MKRMIFVLILAALFIAPAGVSAYGNSGPVSCDGKVIVQCGFTEPQGGRYCQNNHLCGDYRVECQYKDASGLKYCTSSVETQCLKNTSCSGKGPAKVPANEAAILSPAQTIQTPLPTGVVELMPCNTICPVQNVPAGKPVTILTKFAIPSESGINLFTQEAQVFVWIDGGAPFVSMDENRWSPTKAEIDPVMGIVWERTWSFDLPAFKAGNHHVKIVFYFPKTFVVDGLGFVHQGVYLPTREVDLIVK